MPLTATERSLPVSFSSFVISLAGSAMMHLGVAPDPRTGQTQKNLVLARNTIDLMGMIAEKTKGNLDDEESKLVATLLAELRTKFVAQSND